MAMDRLTDKYSSALEKSKKLGLSVIGKTRDQIYGSLREHGLRWWGFSRIWIDPKREAKDFYVRVSGFKRSDLVVLEKIETIMEEEGFLLKDKTEMREADEKAPGGKEYFLQYLVFERR